MLVFFCTAIIFWHGRCHLMDRHSIHQQLLLSGEKERLKDYLRVQLNDSGWARQIYRKIMDIIAREGQENVTVESISSQILNEAQDLVPEHIRLDIYNQIQVFLSK